jgi:hypothetical protein
MSTAREVFSEITSIDNRLLRTVIGLFRNPQRVVKASLEGQDTYTRPLRYLFFTSTMFIVWRFLYENYVQALFREQYPVIDWYLPRRITDATAQFINLEDTFFPFQILLLVVPLAIVPLKLFFPFESWREARHVTLYSFGQFWLVLSVLVPVLTLLDNELLLPILIVFGLIGFLSRKILSGNLWVGLAKWIALGYVLIIWFYHIVLPATQWGLIKIVLSDRYSEVSEPAMPLEAVTLPITGSGVEFVVRDPDNRYFNIFEKQEGLLVQCFQSDTMLLWQTILPGVTGTREAFSVPLPSFERGFLLLAEAPATGHAILISATGKILFTKTYNEEMALNGGDLVNETLVLTGGKSNGEGIAAFIDVLKLKFEPEKGVYELAEERTHFVPGVGNRFDDTYAISISSGGLDVVVSKFETTKPTTGAVEINRVSVMHVNVDGDLQTLWETEIFKRTSKYAPVKDWTFQMRYDPIYQRIVAFYSLSDDLKMSAQLFSLDTLGRISLQKEIKVNELTYLTDVYSAQDGIYFCGWTELGIRSPLLGFGSQGLLGFISNDEGVSMVNVGKDRQAHYLSFFKIVGDDSLTGWGVRNHHVLIRKTEWELMKFDRQLF